MEAKIFVPAGAADVRVQKPGRWSVVALIGANLIPLVGVLLGGWSLFPILLLFSLENIVIGFYNVLRMSKAPLDPKQLQRESQGTISGKRGLILFFSAHYGMFVFGHLLFVVVLFGWPNMAAQMMESGGGAEPPPPIGITGASWLGFLVAFLGLWISHGISYFRNFLGQREYERVTANELMLRPYGRMIVMHVTILAGAFAIIWTGVYVAPLAILVVLKIGLDLIAHRFERRKLGQAA